VRARSHLSRIASAVIVAALLGAGVAACGGHTGVARLPPRVGIARLRVKLGRSVEGRPIRAVEVGNPRAATRILVVGCVHGDEPAGIAVAKALERSRPSGVDLWVIDTLNPDGVHRRSRQNARAVDLNRNFPWRWRPLGRPGDQQYSGPAPLSEPESRFAHALVQRLRPALSIWFHQPLGVVDQSGGDPAVEARFARLAGLPVRRLQRYPGSAVSWENRLLPASTAFVVELPAGRLHAGATRRYAGAVLRVGHSG
jgi:protein MpaA